MDFIRLLAVAYIYQHAICGYAGHMTVCQQEWETLGREASG